MCCHQEEKARKAAAKKAAQERRKAEHEVARFKGKVALEGMIASVDTKIVEKGLIGGILSSAHLLFQSPTSECAVFKTDLNIERKCVW